METYGRPVKLVSAHIIPTDTGHILITVGRGYPIITGAGRLFIMAGGFMMIFRAGYGFPEMNGRLHG